MLTSKQRAELRSEANTLETTLMVGKGGVTENVIEEAARQLEARELVKGRVLETALMSAREVSDEICAALGADGINGPMSAKIIGGMTPPIGVWVSTLVAPSKFTETEKETAKTAMPMGLCFITEGVLPFAAADPARFVPASMLGSGIAGGLAVAMGVESVAGHGGVFVFPMMVNPLWAVIALVVGSVVTGVVYAFIKKPGEEVVEEEIVDLDIDL